MIYDNQPPRFAFGGTNNVVTDVPLPCLAVEPWDVDAFRAGGAPRRYLDNLARTCFKAYDDVDTVTVYNAETGEVLHTYRRKG